MLIRPPFHSSSIFLGAALAVGTAMGIASAIILYIASFFLTDSSTMEEKLAQRAEMFPDDLQERFRQRRKSSAAKKRVKSGGESVIGQAIQESLDRAKQKQRGLVESDESAEDEDYFGPDDTNLTRKGKGRSTSGDQSLTASARRTPTHFGPPLPVGATGWNHSRSDSSSSSPALSPNTSFRNHAPSVTTPPAYLSAKGKMSASPLTSPDVFRSRSSRQRRGVSASL